MKCFYSVVVVLVITDLPFYFQGSTFVMVILILGQDTPLLQAVKAHVLCTTFSLMD